MNKKIIVSLVVVVTMIVGILAYNNVFNQPDLTNVVAGGYRDGISIMPTEYDATGIGVETDFIVNFDENTSLSLEELQTKFSIEPAVPFGITQEDEGFRITLSEPMNEGILVKCQIGQTSWVFKTESGFEILGTLPRHQGTNVPTDSGIEIYFTHAGASLDGYFDISPSVNGRFEYYGNTAVFVPKALEPQTVYTVTLKKGLPLDGSEHVLTEDHTFSFETDYDDSGTYKEPSGYFNFRKTLNDFSTSEAVVLPFNYSIYKEKYGKTIQSTVYKYDTLDSAAEGIIAYMDTPMWSYYNSENREADMSNLNKVMSFEQTIEDPYGYEGLMQIEADFEDGVYFVESSWEDLTFYTFFQVSDTSFYYIEDSETGYFWIHDLATGAGIDGEVAVYGSDASYSGTDSSMVEVPLKELEQDAMVVYKVSGNNGTILMYDYTYEGFEREGAGYWRYIQTDRNLYQPDDEVSFFGFLQNRTNGTSPEKVTVSVQEQRWYYFDWWFGSSDLQPLLTEEVTLEAGFYKGNLTLPNLDEGGYELVVKDGEHILSRHYITVEKYVKPDYKMEVSKDKEAVFVGDTVNFEMMTSFFEGTPVSDLQVNYQIYGMDYIDGSARTDLDGLVQFSYTPKYMDYAQDQQYGGFSAYAVMPESGELFGYEELRIFVNDINLAIETDLEDELGTVSAKVNYITLDRLNDGTAEDNMDFLADPVADHVIEGVVYRNEWIKTERGETYDFINKVVRKEYDYHMETTEFERITLTTDVAGEAEVNLNLPKEENVHYTVELKTKDTNNRNMAYTRYFSDYEYYYPSDTDRIVLNADKETYKVDETVNIAMVEGEAPLTASDYMFVVAANGVKTVHFSGSNEWVTAFEQSYMPNVEVFAIAFTGTGYKASEVLWLDGDYEDYRIDLTMSTDKTSYKPGDEVTLEILATTMINEEAIPVEDAIINLSIVDEALFALSDQDVSTLEALYQHVDGGISVRKGSHDNGAYDYWYPMPRGFGMMDDGVLVSMEMNEMSKMDTASFAVTETAATEEAGGGVYVRSNFKDTALFMTLSLDSEGKGTYTFTLPDNVTSWRLTGAAISNSLEAGSGTEEVRVSLPFFVNPNVNTTYLTGDEPYVGVAGYGDALVPGELINYEVSCEAVGYLVTGQGTPFEKVNLPLWQLDKGVYDIEIKAWTEEGLSDGFVETIEVIDSYQQMFVSDTYNATTGLTIETNDYGMTNITFADNGAGKYVPYLYGLAYSGGKRVDQAYIAKVAAAYLEAKFDIKMTVEGTELSQYLTDDGGMALLPYSETDLDVTVKLASSVANVNEKALVTAYLYKALYSDEADNYPKALYGLATLGESVLLELNRVASTENLSDEDKLYIAMTYSELGDDYMAKQLYNELYGGKVEAYNEVSRIVAGSNEEDYIKETAMVLPLAASLQLPEAEGFFNYVNNNRSKTYLASADVWKYMETMLESAQVIEPSLTYTYEGVETEVEFGDYYGRTITLPSSKLDDFKVSDVNGDVLVIANYNGYGLIDKEKDNDVSVERRYEDYETGETKWNFEQGDIVKVIIEWDVADSAIDDAYQITDYAPSGLVPIKNWWHYDINDDYYWYRDIDGQAVTFGAYKFKDRTHYRPLYYYARVVSPGSFTADGTLIQGINVTDSFNVGDNHTITIEP